MTDAARAWLFGLVLALSGPAAHAAAVVADGDSFELAGQRYRLQDIDAPELHQTCMDEAGRRWPCGRHARNELRRLIGRHDVACVPVGKDRFGRLVATCTAGGRDLGEAMVRAGLATAYRGRGSLGRYFEAEAEARRERRGIWSGTFTTPREWRAENSRERTATARKRDAASKVQDWFKRTGEQVRQAVARWRETVWPRPDARGERLRPLPGR